MTTVSTMKRLVMSVALLAGLLYATVGKTNGVDCSAQELQEVCSRMEAELALSNRHIQDLLAGEGTDRICASLVEQIENLRRETTSNQCMEQFIEMLVRQKRHIVDNYC